MGRPTRTGTSSRRSPQPCPHCRRRFAVQALRFLSGFPMDGRRHSNATFWRRGTRRIGYPPYLITWGWWNLAAGWQRATVRLCGLLVVSLALTVWIRVVAP
jgi:hypothetical protein